MTNGIRYSLDPLKKNIPLKKLKYKDSLIC